MNKWLLTLSGIAMLTAIFLAAVLPIRRGPLIHCFGGIDTRMQVRGFPFSYSTTSGQRALECTDDLRADYNGRPVKDTFDTKNMLMDLAIYTVLIVGSFIGLDRMRVKP